MCWYFKFIILNGCVGLIPALTSIGSSSLELAHRIASHICTEVLDNNLFVLMISNFVFFTEHPV